MLGYIMVQCGGAMTEPMRKITALECTCLRCGHVWVARGEAPVRCAGCGSVYWSRPRRTPKR